MEAMKWRLNYTSSVVLHWLSHMAWDSEAQINGKVRP